MPAGITLLHYYTGRTDGVQLKRPAEGAPDESVPMFTQSARSLAFDSAVERPTIRIWRFVFYETEFITETITSRMGATFVPKKLDLVDHHERHLLHIASIFPAAADSVPLLRRRNYRVRVYERAHVRACCHPSAQPNAVRAWDKNWRPQSLIRSHTRALSGAMYITLEPGAHVYRTRMLTISAAIVFPLLVDAPNRTLPSVWYSV